MEENDDVITDIDENDILCFIFRANTLEWVFVKTSVIHKNNEYDDRKILFDEKLVKLLKKEAGFEEDESIDIEYSNRPFDTSRVEMEIGNKYLVGNFSKIFVKKK